MTPGTAPCEHRPAGRAAVDLAIARERFRLAAGPPSGALGESAAVEIEAGDLGAVLIEEVRYQQRVDELIHAGLSWVDARQIAGQEFPAAGRRWAESQV